MLTVPPQAATEEARASGRMNIDFMVTVAVDGLSRSREIQVNQVNDE